MDEALLQKLVDMKIEKEDELDKELKKQNIADKAVDAVKAALRLLRSVKDDLPAGAGEGLMNILAQWAGYGYPPPGVVKPVEGGSKGKEYEDGIPEPKKKGDAMGEKEIFEKVPEEVRPKLEALWKSSEEKITEAVKKSEELEKVLKAERDERLKKEFIQKAEQFKNLSGESEKLGLLLKTIHDAAPEKVADFLTLFKSAEEKISKGSLFKEIGSSVPGSGGDSWGKIEKAAESYAVENKVTKAHATAEILKRPEFKKLYNEYESEKGVK